MYDMYPWNTPVDPGETRRGQDSPDWPGGRLPVPRDGASPAGPVGEPASEPVSEPVGEPASDPAESAVRAVQFALDRRDNGGDALSTSGQLTAYQTRQ